MAMLELARRHSVAVGLVSDIIVIYYEQTPTLAAAETIDVASSRGMAKLERVNALVVIESSARTPEQSVRLAIQKTMRRFEAKTDALAYAVLGDGFGSATARAVISGMLLFVRPSYPAKVFSSVPSAVAWLQSRCQRRETASSREDSRELTSFCSRERVLPV